MKIEHFFEYYTNGIIKYVYTLSPTNRVKKYPIIELETALKHILIRIEHFGVIVFKDSFQTEKSGTRFFFYPNDLINYFEAEKKKNHDKLFERYLRTEREYENLKKLLDEYNDNLKNVSKLLIEYYGDSKIVDVDANFLIDDAADMHLGIQNFYKQKIEKAKENGRNKS